MNTERIERIYGLIEKEQKDIEVYENCFFPTEPSAAIDGSVENAGDGVRWRGG